MIFSSVNKAKPHEANTNTINIIRMEGLLYS